MNDLLTGVTITEADIEKIAQTAEQGEESLRQIYDWAYQTETLTIQLVAALWLAVIGGLLASFLSLASTRGYLFYWREWLAFAIVIVWLSGLLYQRWRRFKGFKDCFLNSLKSYQKKKAARKAAG